MRSANKHKFILVEDSKLLKIQRERELPHCQILENNEIIPKIN